MIDAIIAAGYVAILLHQRDRLSLACLFAFCSVVTIISTPFADTVHGVTLSYTLFFASYSTLSLYSLNKNHIPLSVAAAIMAFYDLIFAVDSFANYQDETFIWRHHEAFVLILHAVLMCILSQKLNSFLRSGWYNFCMLFNIGTPIKPDHTCNGRKASEEGYQ